MQKRGSETALILTLMKPPIAGDEQGLIQKFMMGRKKGRRVVGREDWMEEVALAPNSSYADSDPHSTVVMLRRTPSSSFRNSPASVTMLKGAAPSASSSVASSKWRLPLLCLLLTALAVAVVAPALAALSGRDRDPRSSSSSAAAAVDNAAPVSDDSGRWTRQGEAAILDIPTAHLCESMRSRATFQLHRWPRDIIDISVNMTRFNFKDSEI